ncbi:MAG: hypothetical protein RBR67_07230 [Desulfobacterium sp.]|jgi:hypothetical protein|nr:hypothetical protein [Desulfobacterium sp.]
MNQTLTDFTVDILENDAHAVGRSRLFDELLEMETALKRKMDRGVTPEEARKIEIIRRAIESSRMITDKIWNSRYN